MTPDEEKEEEEEDLDPWAGQGAAPLRYVALVHLLDGHHHLGLRLAK